jgi:hypothetical protein
MLQAHENPSPAKCIIRQCDHPEKERGQSGQRLNSQAAQLFPRHPELLCHMGQGKQCNPDAEYAK